MAVTILIIFFGVKMLCRLVCRSQCFREVCCLHFKGRSDELGLRGAIYVGWQEGKSEGKMDQILRDVIKIELHLDNKNEEDFFSLSWAWKPLIRDLKEWRQSHTKELTPSNGPWKGLTLFYPPLF
jgi:hypothetical protein